MRSWKRSISGLVGARLVRSMRWPVRLTGMPDLGSPVAVEEMRVVVWVGSKVSAEAERLVVVVGRVRSGRRLALAVIVDQVVAGVLASLLFWEALSSAEGIRRVLGM